MWEIAYLAGKMQPRAHTHLEGGREAARVDVVVPATRGTKRGRVRRVCHSAKGGMEGGEWAQPLLDIVRGLRDLRILEALDRRDDLLLHVDGEGG